MGHVKVQHVAVFLLLFTLLFVNYVMPAVPGLRSLGARVMVVASNSMSPFLNFGDVVVLTGVDPEEIGVGDVIAFNVAPRFQQQYNYPPVVTHRVIEVIREDSELCFQTKGDATAEDPFTVPARDVIGRYAWKIPHVGLPFLFMRSIYGISLLLSYIAMDLALTYGPQWWRKRREKEEAISKALQDALRSLPNYSNPNLVFKRKHGAVKLMEASQPVKLTVRRR